MRTAPLRRSRRSFGKAAIAATTMLASRAAAFLGGRMVTPARRSILPLPSSSSLRMAAFSTSTASNSYDVIIVGGGHAGCEAATASARTGAKTALITQRIDTIGELSCNPSIGGIGKGHLVREVDALGGVMGEVADLAGIHFRMLNRRKGPAVRGPRGQMDRDLYKEAMQELLLEYPNLDIVEGGVEDLLLEEGVGIESGAPLADGSDAGVKLLTNSGIGTNGEEEGERAKKAAALASSAANDSHRKARIRGAVVKDTETGLLTEILGNAVVVTTGTFLRGVLMIGRDRYSGGRHLRDSEQVEPPSVGLASTLSRFDFPLGRLKTGTPPRLDGRTINWDACLAQPTEIPAAPFSHLRQSRGEQPPNIAAGRTIECRISKTNDATHHLVMKYAHLLPEYDGMEGKGNGPRYCPSIYKKVERFPERTSHNSFLEPEGLKTHIVYPNGMSGPYPEEKQLEIMRTMVGLEEVEIVRPGYDVEYDFVNPQSLTHTLETKSIAGLYLAGQICGTTGYEEAAAQGIVAGANAGRAAGAASRNELPPRPFVIGRDEGYIGVLVDDLVTKGTSEPYRMFTSRAEYRISLRADNADLRLTRKAIEHGLVDPDSERAASVEAREMSVEDRIKELKDFKLFVTEWAERGDAKLMGGDAMHRKGREGDKKSAEEVLGMPHVTLGMVEDVMVKVQTEEREMMASAVAAMSMHDGEASDGGDGDGVETEEEQEEDPLLPRVIAPSPPATYDTVEASVKYKSYVVRQHRDMESWRKAQGARIPPDLDYNTSDFPTLSKEELEKLDRLRPNTFAEASNISGLTPQSLVYLYHHVMRRNKQRDRERREKLEATATVSSS